MVWGLAVGAALAVIAVVVVLLPFLRRRAPAVDAAPATDAEAARAQREALYRTLETLRLERALGQVDAAEYAAQLDAYRRRAALLVREQERLLAESAAPDDELERAVQEARARLQAAEDEAP